MSVERANFSCVMRYPIAAVCAFLLCIVLPANSAVGDYFLIIDGPGAGIRLAPSGLMPTPGSPTRVIPDDNPVTKADGRISIGPECLDGLGNEAPHFHGSLFRQGDPHPGACGWGKVAVVHWSEPVAILGVSIEDEQRALRSEELYLKNLALWNGIYSLTEVINKLASMDNLPPSTIDRLNQAKALDLDAIRALRDYNVQDFTSLVNDALEIKREVLPFLVGARR